MRHLSGLLLAAGASTLLTGCLATQSQLKHASDLQSVELSQTQAALNTERVERAASDSALARQLGVVAGDVQALRTDLETMRADFGARIVAMEDGLHFAMPVNFAFDDATVRTVDTTSLQRFARVAQRYYPQSKITVEGFADPAGSAQYNLQLSRRRAEAVRRFLGSQGLASGQVSTVGYGETRQVTPGAWGDKPGAELNRRVVFVIESMGERTVAMGPQGPQQ